MSRIPINSGLSSQLVAARSKPGSLINIQNKIELRGCKGETDKVQNFIVQGPVLRNVCESYHRTFV
jgi:hypothetical protein